MKKETVIDLICILFIILFVYAAVSKLSDLQKFNVQIGKSPLISKFSSLLIWIIPILEIGISICLAIPRFRTIASYAAFTLMALFTEYIYTILHYSENIPCSCGGILQNMTWQQHFIFNIFFVVLAALNIILIKRNETHSANDLKTSNFI